jgi:hypothetical protein
LRIESKRFVEEETYCKDLDWLLDELNARTCDFAAAQPRWLRYFQ